MIVRNSWPRATGPVRRTRISTSLSGVASPLDSDPYRTTPAQAVSVDGLETGLEVRQECTGVEWLCRATHGISPPYGVPSWGHSSYGVADALRWGRS